ACGPGTSETSTEPVAGAKATRGTGEGVRSNRDIDGGSRLATGTSTAPRAAEPVPMPGRTQARPGRSRETAAACAPGRPSAGFSSDLAMRACTLAWSCVDMEPLLLF